jgi:hypothetical protein
MRYAGLVGIPGSNFKRASGKQIIYVANPAINRRATIVRPYGRIWSLDISNAKSMLRRSGLPARSGPHRIKKLVVPCAAASRLQPSPTANLTLDA